MIDFEESVQRIKKECLPLPLLYTLKNPKVRSRINTILVKTKLAKEDAEGILRVTYDSGGFQQYEDLTGKLAENALFTLSSMKLKTRSLQLFIQAMLPQVSQTTEFLN